MNNLVLFLNSFLSYLLVFVIIVALVILAVFLGIQLRKKKDEKDTQAMLQEQQNATTTVEQS